MFAFISWLIFGLAVLLWVVIFVVFVVVKIRNTVQRKKYSVKQDGDVSTKYESRANGEGKEYRRTPRCFNEI